jgi:hypothetical protein
MQKLDFTDVNKFFNAPLSRSSPKSPNISDKERWARECYGRHHGRTSSISSSSSSSITLTNDDEQLVAAFKSLKYAWDDPVPAHQAQKGWSQIQAQLASSRAPSGYLPPPRPPGANPHAPPFIPSQQRRNSISRPSHRHSSSFSSISSPPTHRSSSPKPNWYSAFSDGTSTYSSEEHVTLAADLVSYRPWTPDALAELARRFCVKGTKAMALGTATPRGTAIIEFLTTVIEELANDCGDWYAGSFKWHLGECAIGTFKSCYQSVSFPTLLHTLYPILTS